MGRLKHNEVLEVYLTEDSSCKEELETARIRKLIAVGLATQEHREINASTHQGERPWNEATLM